VLLITIAPSELLRTAGPSQIHPRREVNHRRNFFTIAVASSLFCSFETKTWRSKARMIRVKMPYFFVSHHHAAASQSPLLCFIYKYDVLSCNSLPTVPAYAPLISFCFLKRQHTPIVCINPLVPFMSSRQ
jgi:hypothetical protein